MITIIIIDKWENWIFGFGHQNFEEFLKNGILKINK